MPSVVNDKCKKCRSCKEVCPVDAFVESDAGSRLVVDPELCIDCGVCISECPEMAITSDSEASDADIAFNAEKAKEWK